MCLEESYLNKISTLLVDDNQDYLEVAGRTLRRCYDAQLTLVGAAFDGEQALRQAAALRPRLVLIDLMMPGLSGLQVIPALREHCPESWIVALSVRGDDRRNRAALEAGAHFVIFKSQLESALQAMLPGVGASLPSP